MRIVLWIVVALFLMICGLCNAADRSNYTAAVEYIRCLATLNDLGVEAKTELAKAKGLNSLMTDVRVSTKAKLELRPMIAALNQLDVGDDATEFVHDLVGLFQQKIDLYDALIDIASNLLGGPKPGVDYGKLMASTAEIRATMEGIDKLIFNMANAFFVVMVDLRPDSKGHASHLRITRAQRAELLKLIEARFGASLESKDKSYIVSGAWLMRSNLRKGFKATDDPW